MHPSIMLLQASIACAESDAERRESFNRQHEQCPRTRRCVSKSPTRWRRALKAPAQWLLIGMMGWSITALAQPVDTWNTVHGFDCVSDPYNPIREDGTRDPQGDPEPLSATTPGFTRHGISQPAGTAETPTVSQQHGRTSGSGTRSWISTRYRTFRTPKSTGPVPTPQTIAQPCRRN